MTSFLDTDFPDPAVIVLIGPAGSGKSTLASTWEPTQVLSLDHYRALVSDSAGDQSATGDAVFALLRVLEARLRRGLTSVVDATSTNPEDRATLLATACRYGVPTVALIVPTPLSVCLERNASRTGDLHVPEDAVRAQHQAMVATASPTGCCERASTTPSSPPASSVSADSARCCSGPATPGAASSAWTAASSRATSGACAATSAPRSHAWPPGRTAPTSSPAMTVSLSWKSPATTSPSPTGTTPTARATSASTSWCPAPTAPTATTMTPVVRPGCPPTAPPTCCAPTRGDTRSTTA
ncbi:ATP-binding protein [Streptomyces sp. NPDC048324]|uniref:ATP-binding protein n=1 Tax=Streptomyces sp. NPDC048324 TaxID=3157205 RepID=UPI0034371BF3